MIKKYYYNHINHLMFLKDAIIIKTFLKEYWQFFYHNLLIQFLY